MILSVGIAPSLPRESYALLPNAVKNHTAHSLISQLVQAVQVVQVHGNTKYPIQPEERCSTKVRKAAPRSPKALGSRLHVQVTFHAAD